VNTSDYGDSRIIQPTKTEERDIVQSKGGENPTVLIGTINTRKLRDFQLQKYGGHEDAQNLASSHYKPIPPSYDRRILNERLNHRQWELLQKKK
jgi:hypothetical protein